MIAIVDYGIGNLGSIRNMMRKVGAAAEISGDPEDLRSADKLILPGVGSFDRGMQHLTDRGLIDVLNQRVVGDGVPILGICLGMQLMARRSEEGKRPGLGWIDAEARRFEANGLKVPHMGWNEVTAAAGAALFAEFAAPPKFYFVHSYHVCCRNPEDVLATAVYGRAFTAAVHRRNILGTQFHPEKSHKFGMRLLRNFSELSPSAVLA